MVDFHLEVQSSVLGHMARRVTVLGTEHGADFVHAVHICRNAHLLVQLRALCEKGVAAKIGDLEDARTTLARAALELGRVCLGKATRRKV